MKRNKTKLVEDTFIEDETNILDRPKDWGGNKRTTYAQLGASNHTDTEREAHDFYATDPIAIDRLAQVYTIPKNIIEISAGNGHLSERLKELGHNVISYDLVQRSYSLDKVQNFLECEELPKGYNVLTNPPFNISLEFVLHSLKLLEDGQQAIFFLKIQFLESAKRYKELFSKYPPKHIFVFTERCLCAMNGEFEIDGKRQSSAVCYAWYIWEKGYKGNTTLGWC